jgi:hypothetical protein
MDFRINVIDDAAENTCKWLCAHANYKKWIQTRSSLLWIKGKPGAGKSTLIKYAVRQGNPDGVRTASFFCNGRGSALEKSPLGLYRSILHQLLPRAPDQLSRLALIYKERCQTRGEFGKIWGWHEGELKDRLTDLLLAPAVQPVRIYLDALDESGEDIALQITEYFQSLVSKASQADNALRVCLSCRHYPINALDCGLDVCVENENSRDIADYVRGRFKESRVGREKAQVLEEDIVERANGVFQWVVLVVPRIISQCRKGKNLQNIQAEIKKLPQELRELYHGILEDIPDNERPYSLRLMRWICFALEPLNLRKMRFAMLVDADSPYNSLSEYMNTEEYVETDEDMENRVTDLSRGLAEVRRHDGEDSIQFIHQSVNDYLVQGGLQLLENTTTGCAIGRAHLSLARSCIRYIEISSITIDVGLERLKSWFIASAAGELEHKYPLIRYATISWIPHIVNAEKTYMPQEDLMQVFRIFHLPSDDRMKEWVELNDILDIRLDTRPA